MGRLRETVEPSATVSNGATHKDIGVQTSLNACVFGAASRWLYYATRTNTNGLLSVIRK